MRSARHLLGKGRSLHLPTVKPGILHPFCTKRNPLKPQNNDTIARACVSSEPLPTYDKADGHHFVYASSPNTAHNDLESFISYAERTGLDRSSTTFVGTHFEYTTSLALRRFGFRLERVGAKSDCGIDLLGTWSLPSAQSRPTNVLVQCKAIKKPGPNLIRELEGSFAAAPAGWRSAHSLGILVIEKPATKGMREAMGRSRWPMVCISCTRAGKVEQMIWNNQAAESALGRMGVTTRHSEDGDQELVMTFKGQKLTGDMSAFEPDDPTVWP
ncbi:hypothetical protein OQA88_11926 [Cercophora sp. LCS_1]